MAQIQFDEQALVKSLTSLAAWQRVAFACCCGERLLPNYVAFSIVENWGEPALLRQALNTAWSVASGTVVPDARIRDLAGSCQAIAPDTEDFTSFLTTPALEAAAAVGYALDCSLDGDPARAALAARSAVDALQVYLDQVTDPYTGYHGADQAFDHWLAGAPLLIAELEQQHRDVAILRAGTERRPDLVARLRRIAEQGGLQPFARGLVKKPSC